MSDNKLVLYPKEPSAPLPDTAVLRDGLTALGLLGEPFVTFGETRFGQGTRFFSLVRFRQSRTATVIDSKTGEFDKMDNRALCTVAFRGPTEEIEFLGGANVADPACPTCGSSESDWPAIVSAWYDARKSYTWQCPTCRSTLSPWQLDWRNSNGFSRFAIDIWHVHEGEAVPSQELLDYLGARSKTVWDYFFYRL